MQRKNLLAALFLCASIEGMEKSQKFVAIDEHYEICLAALRKINTTIDVYLENYHDKATSTIEDIRLKEPLLKPWCLPTKQGLLLEILSKLHLTKKSVRYSIRTPWGLLPLIESDNTEESLKSGLFPDLLLADSIRATFAEGPKVPRSMQKYNQHMTVWEKEKYLILQVANITIIPAREDIYSPLLHAQHE